MKFSSFYNQNLQVHIVFKMKFNNYCDESLYQLGLATRHGIDMLWQEISGCTFLSNLELPRVG